MTESVDLGVLVASAESPLDSLRIGMEDALKEYAEYDLIVELLQNALDSTDHLRYVAICQAAGVDPTDAATVELWNQAVEAAIQEDCDAFVAIAADDASGRATWYGKALDDSARRRAWWELLASKIGGTAEALAAAASAHRGSLLVDVTTGASSWLAVEDSGLGMSSVLAAFRMTSSDKRARPGFPRRHGVRGAHGWGLTAVLGLSDRVEVASRHEGVEECYVFENFASFARGEVPQPTISPTSFTTVAAHGKSLQSGSDGVVIRVRISDPSETNLLGYALKNPSLGRLVNLLRLYTPVGQVNDYLAHPGYHCSRTGDIDVTLRWRHDSGAVQEQAVPFQLLTIAELPNAPALDYKAFVNGSMPSRRSVHTLYRGNRGGQNFLSAADIQPADIWHDLEADLDQASTLPGLIGDSGSFVGELPRGFQVAVSGGMRTEYRAREPKGTSAAFRGVILQENQPPTLGRRTVLDQRRSLPKVAADHESAYESVRKKLVGKAEPQPQTLASARWRLQHFDSIRTSLRHSQPQTEELHVWAGADSGEARVMLAFAELLGRGVFGDLRVLRCGLAHAYDFSFIQFTQAGELDAEVQRKLIEAGYAESVTTADGRDSRYGLGEFKDVGESVLGEFDESVRQKQANTIDLLVCQSFSEDGVTNKGWTSAAVDAASREFLGQTHAWTPAAGYAHRQRAMAVVSLEQLIADLSGTQELTPFSGTWPDLLPPLFPASGS